MQLITAEQRAALLANGAASAKRDIDPHPVVKLFTPDAGATWLLTELDPTEPDIAFGLCDLGVGCPELGYVRLSELQTVRGKLGLPVERDLWFEAKGPLSAYVAAAHRAEHIVCGRDGHDQPAQVRGRPVLRHPPCTADDRHQRHWPADPGGPVGPERHLPARVPLQEVRGAVPRSASGRRRAGLVVPAAGSPGARAPDGLH
jgi:Protein of unknown function (DUF2958)